MDMPTPNHNHVSSPIASQARFQFSVRDLLITTTVVSICLAVGIHFAGMVFVVAVVGIVQTSVLLAGDWLIRPQNRRALAFASAGSWATLGSGFLVLSLGSIFGSLGESFEILSARIESLSWWVALVLGFAAAILLRVGRSPLAAVNTAPSNAQSRWIAGRMPTDRRAWAAQPWVNRMPNLRCQFSLRSMFLAMTLIATLVAMIFNYPIIAFFALMFMSPFLFVATMASLTNGAPNLARAVRFLLVGAAILFIAFLLLMTSKMGG